MNAVPEKIFIVEDEALIAMELKDRLQRLGYSVCGVAPRGETALEQIATTSPDLVLMDINLAGSLNGIETAERLAGAIDVPIVFLTAYSDDDLVRRAAQTGPFGYIVKPFEERELHASIQTALFKHRMERALREANERLEEQVRLRTERLRQSEARLQYLLSASPAVIYSVPAPGDASPIFVSPNVETLAGYSAAELEESPELWESRIHAEDREAARDLRRRIREVGRSTVEYRFRHKNGHWMWIRDDATLAAQSADAGSEIVGAWVDITHRKEAELSLRDLNSTLEKRVEARTAALAESEQFFSSLSQASPVGVFRSDAQGTCIFVNERGLEMAGLEPSDATEDGWKRALHPEDREPVLEAWYRAVEARRPFRSEYRFLRPDGSTIWIISQAVEILSADGELTGFVGTFTDITERKQIEIAMQALSSELVSLEGEAFVEAAVRRLTELLEVDVGLVSQYDSTHANAFRCLSMRDSGQSTKAGYFALAGTPCAHVLAGKSILLEEGAHCHAHAGTWLHDFALEAYAGEPLTDLGDKIIGHVALGSRRPFRNPATITTILRMFAVAIAAAIMRERNQRQYQDLFEFAPDGLVMVDASGRIALMNHQAERIFGWTRDEIVGQPVELLVPTSIRESHVEHRNAFSLAPAQRTMGASRSSLWGVRKDGTEFPAEIELAWVESTAGPIVAAAVRDITARRALEAQLAHAMKMEAIGKLTGGLAHDFNNYLGVIVCSLEVIKIRENVAPGVLDLIDDALAGAECAAELTKSLLAFARRQPLDARTIAVHERLPTVAHLIRRTVGQGIDVTLELAADLWPVTIDAAQLDTSIINLANNARDAMKGGGKLKISARNAHVDALFAETLTDLAPGEYVLIEVADTGIGMSPETLQRAFEPFFTTKAVGHGTGLGLSMVYGFAKQSGGHIDVSSAPGHGTSVRIYLPRASESRQATAGAPSNVRDSRRGAAERILVVDDNERMRHTAAAMLQALGYEILTAEDGDSALAILSRPEPVIHLLFTDVVMPGSVDGFELVQRARSLRPGIRALMASGYAGEALRHDSRGQGVAALISKPYFTEDLAWAVRAALDYTVEGCSG